MKGSKAGASDANSSTKRKAAGGAGRKPGKREKKLGKDPNKPKRPASAFFVFMEEFRKEFQEKNPNNKLVSVVSKAGGDRWKTMSESDKAPFVAKAEKRKAEYFKNMAAYDKKKSEGSGRNDSAEEGGEGSDKSKSEVEDEDQEGSGEEEEDDD